MAAFLGAAVLGAVGWMLWPSGPQVPQEPTVDETPADGSASDGEEPRPDTPEAPGPTEAATPQEAASPTEVLIAEDPTPPPGAPEATPAEPAPSEPTPQADVVFAGDPWEVDETPAPVAEPPPLAVARIRHDPAADLPAVLNPDALELLQDQPTDAAILPARRGGDRLANLLTKIGALDTPAHYSAPFSASLMLLRAPSVDPISVFWSQRQEVFACSRRGTFCLHRLRPDKP